jgi:uncharacterized protein (DUF111 family)
MTFCIHSEVPFTLSRLLEPWRKLHPDEREQTEHGWLERLLAQAKAYREGISDAFWKEEVDALRTLAAAGLGQKGPLYATPLVVPRGLPLHLLPLLEGLAVGDWVERAWDECFSPLALLWLKAAPVRFSPFPRGTMRRVAAGDGIAVLQIEEDPGIPVVCEERKHADEHIDEGMMLLQANLDDVSPEWMAYALERLLEAGANDVTFIPMTMKKSRPGVLLQVLCYRSDLEVMKSILFTETTTFGLRYFPVSVHRLARRFVTVATRWGEVRVKLGFHHGERVQVSPEYESCARLAKAAGVSLQSVYMEARRLAGEGSAGSPVVHARSTDC